YVRGRGMRGRDLAEGYGVYTAAYNRFNRGSRRGIWKQIFDQVAVRSRVGLYFIDSTVVKAHRCASGGKGGRKIKQSASAAVGERRKTMPLSITKAVLCTSPSQAAKTTTAKTPQKGLTRRARPLPPTPARP